jgi:hypothetical protein
MLTQPHALLKDETWIRTGLPVPHMLQPPRVKRVVECWLKGESRPFVTIYSLDWRVWDDVRAEFAEVCDCDLDHIRQDNETDEITCNGEPVGYLRDIP